MSTYALVSRILAPALVLGLACASEPPAGTDTDTEGDGDGDPGDGDGDVEELRSEAPHDDDPQLAQDQIDALAAANHALTLDLYHALREGEVAGEGFAISAYSVSSAFGMLYAGSVDPARAQIAESLRFPFAGEQQHVAHNWLDAQLASRNQVDPESGDALTLTTSNGLWLLDDLASGVPQDFLDVLAVHYDAGVHLADFTGDPEGEREQINAWVSDRTNALIPELFPEQSIHSLTTLVLVNALYLKGGWAAPFADGLTTAEDFTRLDDQVVSVQMMHAPLVNAGYAATADYEAVSLTLYGSQLDVVLILPTDFGAFEASLDPATLAELLGSLDAAPLDLRLPRFELDASLELTNELEGLGMLAPFDDDSSFDGIHPDVDHIQVVVHDTVIKVDEDGIEAAAATGIGGDGDGDTEPDPPTVVTFDRPFLLAVRDYPTDTLLFFGRVLDPS